jgi:hypothetical protein
MLATSVQETVKPVQLTEGEIKFYKDMGYLFIPGLVSLEDAAAMRQEVLDILEQQGTPLSRLRQALGAGDKLRQSGQYLEGSAIDGLVNGRGLLGIAEQLMGGPSTLYLPFTGVKNGGGGGRFHFHQDNQYTRFDGPGINLWTALERMSPENGCLEIVPRSHIRGTLESDDAGDGTAHRRVQTEPEDFLPIRMNAGDCVAFSRLTVHGSGPNTTSEPRIAYAVQFHRDDVKAVWDNQEPRLLKNSNRWSTRPVKQITPPKEASRDGH